MSNWHLIFRAEGDGAPPECRVRRLLKAALRYYGLRCVGYGSEGNAVKKVQAAANNRGRAAGSETRRRNGSAHGDSRPRNECF